MTHNNSTQKYKELREQFPEFHYKDYKYWVSNGQLNIEFEFVLSDKYYFFPQHTIPLPSDFSVVDNKTALDNLAFNLGMIELISYWKTTCSPLVRINAGKIDPFQIKWWKKLYFNGLAEFFYVNGIESTLDDFMQIVSESKQIHKKFVFTSENKILVPVGGGKDSAVSLELLKRSRYKIIPFVVNPRGASKETILQAGLKHSNSFFTSRKIHLQLIELNKKGFLNGHTPFSAMLAFLSLIAAFINKAKHIALSNESSANEATVVGTNINHQYSKTYTFEKDFRDYYMKYISSDFNYFSFLRPLSETQIAAVFSRLPQHFFSFKSCNVGSFENVWCAKCPKCLFTYILLAPFISAEIQHKIFGTALLNEPKLKNELDKLTGINENKPFECVGTIEDVKWSLQNAKKEYFDEFLLKNSDIKASDQNLSPLKVWNKENFLQNEFIELLKTQLNN
jgi:hypothetical protein